MIPAIPAPRSAETGPEYRNSHRRFGRPLRADLLTVLFLFTTFLTVSGGPRTAAAAAASITVNSTLEGSVAGVCTLWDAIVAANTDAAVNGCDAGSSGLDTIILPAGTYQATAASGAGVPGPAGFPNILSPIEIAGTDPETTIIKRGPGAPPMGLFYVGGELTLRNVTLTGANGYAAVMLRGSLYLRNTVFENNAAPSNSFGGAIATNWNVIIDIADSVFRNNVGGNGGAVVAAPAHLNIRNSQFLDNSTNGRGGAIRAGGTASISDTEFSSNSAGSDGGALNLSGTATLTRLWIEDNDAGSDGGGIANSGALTVIDSTIANNTARQGGGIAQSSGTLTVTGSTINGNFASGFGGGIEMFTRNPVTIANTTISGNTGREHGGGIYVNIGPLTMNNVTITDNQAGPGNHRTHGRGGGIFIQRTDYLHSMANSILAGNVATNSGPDCAEWFVTSSGYNLVGDACAGFLPTVGDLVGEAANPIDPVLGPLANNGGPTATHALLGGSPAIENGNPRGGPGKSGSCLRCIPPTEEGYAMTKRRRFSGELKAKVALEALRGDRTLQEIASKHQVHPNQVSTWKRQAMEGLGEMFSNGVERRRRDHESEVRELHAKIGELTVERDFLSRGSGR